jgi:hypothetical protein
MAREGFVNDRYHWSCRFISPRKLAAGHKRGSHGSEIAWSDSYEVRIVSVRYRLSFRDRRLAPSATAHGSVIGNAGGHDPGYPLNSIKHVLKENTQLLREIIGALLINSRQ